MEKKSIGGFIAALRKANGMTQKDLAERLNVSDKTVSRWERDDGAPDLATIPAIAEIFGVSCDELLRGARKPPEARDIQTAEDELTPKSEAQCRRLLSISLSRYKHRSYIAMGISVAGLLAAMIGNFGFLRAYIGFLIAAGFYLAAVVSQAVFIDSAFLSVSDDTLTDAQLSSFKRSVVLLAERSFGLTAVLLGLSLPLVLFAGDAYCGLTAETWFGYGIFTALAALILVAVVVYFVNASLLKKGVYTLSEKEAAVYHHNHRLKRICAIALLLIFAMTGIAHHISTALWGPYSIAEGTVFEDYESFVAFMEQDVSDAPVVYAHNSSNSPVTVAPEAQVGPGHYYDEFGNEISEEEALTRRLTDRNGTVVCEYIHHNRSVKSISFTSGDGTLLPITVRTERDMQIARQLAAKRHAIFCTAYCVEAAAVLVIYFKKREHLR